MQVDASPSGINLSWQFEEEAWKQGFTQVAGIDEAGRGPIAGPVVAAAVILPRTQAVPAVNDSKQLSAQCRDALSAQLEANPDVKIGIAAVPVADIETFNILRATHIAMQRAAAALQPQPDFALVDGLPVDSLPLPSQAIVKGDARSASIAAASIIAKVARDRMMVELHSAHPQYGFADNKGYATKPHLAALQKYGPCPAHRRTFAPVARVVNRTPVQLTLDLSNRG